MSTRSAAANVVRAFAAVMAERNVRWYLFGAQAAAIWGSLRLSADVDVTITVAREELTTLIEAMKTRGFTLRFDDKEFFESSRVLPFVHQATQMPLDVVLAGPGLEEDFLARTLRVDVEGVSIPVISPEDLIVQKILASRPKDIEDVRAVIAAQRDTLDVERIRTLLDLLQHALDQSDLLPEFEKHWRIT